MSREAHRHKTAAVQAAEAQGVAILVMQELCEYMSGEVGNPRLFWAYKDEDFVGWCSVVVAPRGGQRTAIVLPLRLLERYRAMSD